MSIAIRNSTDITFTVEEVDDEISSEYPLHMKITLPKEFDVTYTSLYYTPNKKSVIGKLNTQISGKNELICEIDNPGTYVIFFKK